MSAPPVPTTEHVLALDGRPTPAAAATRGPLMVRAG